jgi:hypothetical protein
MTPGRILKGAGRAVLFLAWPWRAARSTFTHLGNAKDVHRQNIVYIKDLFRQASGKAAVTGETDQANQESNVDGAQSFAEVMASRAPSAPGIEALQKRFLLQKRLALGTCCAFVLMALYALAKGHLLGIATLLSCLPLFFMACLSAQLRLWQLRTRRLSPEERGGLKDFIGEIDGWYWQVLDPEFGKKLGKKPDKKPGDHS